MTTVKGKYWVFLDEDFDVTRCNVPSQLLIDFLSARLAEDECESEDDAVHDQLYLEVERLSEEMEKHVGDHATEAMGYCIPTYDIKKAIRAIRQGKTAYVGECEYVAVLGRTKREAEARYGKEAAKGWS